MTTRLSFALAASVFLLPACAVLEETEASEAAASESLVGVWSLEGKDTRGSYSGQVELRPGSGPNAGKVDVIRVVRYEGSAKKVEGDRELWTAWTGSGAGSTLSVDLARADFVKSRGGVTRTEADKKPLTVTGELRSGDRTTIRWSAPGLSAEDTLTKRAANGAKPIFAIQRTSTQVSDPPGFITKAVFKLLCRDYAKVPAVAPYANRPEFKEGVTFLDVDQTDFEFYRENPKALRVINKVVDAPSLGETLARANAYRKTLVDKAALFDAEMPRQFVDPSGQVVHGRQQGKLVPTGDGALWTATYIASQAYRYLVTKDPSVIPNIVGPAESTQILLEIVPDPTTFARTLRAATGTPERGWHQGTGEFAHLQWLEGGNNDMFKGLFYGTLMAYVALCDPVIPGQEALCQRMRKNAAHIPELTVAGGSGDINHLLATWLSAYVNGTDTAVAAKSFDSQDFSIEHRRFQFSEGSTADWSGTHLTFVAFNGLLLLDQKKPLIDRNGNRLDVTRAAKKGIKRMQEDFTRFRMGMWSVFFASPALVDNPAKADTDSLKWRLYETPAPRAALDIDHRVAGDFCMSPYPKLPWKNDCTVNDRTDSLHGYPLFEQSLNVYNWRSSPFDYAGNQTEWESPSFDFLHAYWLGRHLGVIGAKE